jgi:hypothetical protein
MVGTWDPETQRSLRNDFVFSDFLQLFDVPSSSK